MTLQFPPPGYLSVPQVAKRLGTQTTVIYRWLAAGRFPSKQARRYAASPNTSAVIPETAIVEYEQQLHAIDAQGGL